MFVMMNRKLKSFLICCLSVLAVSCGVPQSEYDLLLSEKNALLEEIDELKNGQGRLEAIYDSAILNNEFEKARQALSDLRSKHPQSELSKNFDRLNANLNDLKVERQRIAEAEKLEKERVAEAEKREKDRLASHHPNGSSTLLLGWVNHFGPCSVI